MCAFAQSDGSSTKQIFKRAQYFVNWLETEMHQEIVRVEMDILVDKKMTFRSLEAGQNYKLVAFGDDSISDIDIAIYRYDERDSEYQLIKKDEDNSDVSIITLTPSKSAEYQIEISAYAFKSGHDVGYYGLIICHD